MIEVLKRQFKNNTFLPLFFVSYLIYLPALFGKFLWDDEYQIIRSPDTYSILNIPSVFLKGQQNIFYKPMFFTYLTIVHSIFGLNPFPFHFIQVLMHAINTFLIYLLFKKFFSKEISFLLSLIFLVHPLNVEAIAYISAAGDPLSLFFGLTALHLLIRKKMTTLNYLFATLLLTFSLLSKESGIVILFIISLYNLLFLKLGLRRNIALFITPIAVYSFLRFFVAHTFFVTPNFIPIALAPLVTRLINIPKIIYVYLSDFFVPYHLLVAQHWVVQTVTVKDFLMPLIIDLLFFIPFFTTVVFAYLKKTQYFKALLFFCFWFICSLSLYLQVFPIDMTVAERWFYLPMVGILGFFGVIISMATLRFAFLKKYFLASFIVIFLLFSVRTIVRATDWIDSYTLFGHDMKWNINSFDIESQFGYQLILRGSYDDAIIHATKAIKLSPNYNGSYVVVGAAYLEKKDYKTALQYYKEAYRHDPQEYAVLYGLTFSYLIQKDNNSALKWGSRGLQLFPNDPYLLDYISIAEYRMGNNSKALMYVKKSYEYKKTKLSEEIYSNIVHKKPL